MPWAGPATPAAYFGPCIADSPQTAEKLLRWFLSRHVGERIFWDILSANREAVALAQAYGFQPARELARMSVNLRPAVSTGDVATTFAIAGLEYG